LVSREEIKRNRAYESLEDEIAQLTKQSWEVDFNSELGSRLKSLELDQNKLLMEEEARWRLKSRATWIQNGDKNTKYFHHFC
jgi:hypothetical protein